MGSLGRGAQSDWPEVEPLIERALEHGDGEMTAFDVRRFLDSGDMQLWVAKIDDRVVAACVTEIKNYPRKRALLVRTLAGDWFGAWYEPGMRMLDDYRAEMKLDRIEMHGRQGWMRKLKDWQLRSVTMIYRGSHAV